MVGGRRCGRGRAWGRPSGARGRRGHRVVAVADEHEGGDQCGRGQDRRAAADPPAGDGQGADSAKRHARRVEFRRCAAHRRRRGRRARGCGSSRSRVSGIEDPPEVVAGPRQLLAHGALADRRAGRRSGPATGPPSRSGRRRPAAARSAWPGRGGRRSTSRERSTLVAVRRATTFSRRWRRVAERRCDRLRVSTAR